MLRIPLACCVLVLSCGVFEVLVNEEGAVAATP